jgi:hypothetical protein
MKTKGYVYLLVQIDCEGNELHKIGISKNHPDARVKQLQTGNPNEIRLLTFYESVEYKKVEQWIHSRYSLNKTLADNEWFILANEQVMNFLEDCKKADETIGFLRENNHFFK